MRLMTAACVLALIRVLLSPAIAYSQTPTPEPTPVAPSTTASGRILSPSRRLTAPAVLPTAPGLLYKTYLPETFSVYSSNTEFAFALGGRYVTAGPPTFGRQLELPQGAQLVEVTLFFVDNAPGDLTFLLYEQSPDSTVAILLGNASSTGVSEPSVASVTISGASPVLATIDNAQRTYNVEMNLPSYSSNHRAHGIRVGYRFGGAFLPITPRRE